jgi:hypothetical protein
MGRLAIILSSLSLYLGVASHVGATDPATKTTRKTLSVFVGVWNCGNCVITLRDDFTAHNSATKSLSGKWECVNGEAHITWDNGSRHVLRRDGQGFQKLFWPVGASPDSPPRHVQSAVKKSEPIEAIGIDSSVFVGVWHCGNCVITLKDDFTAHNSKAKPPLGKWECVNGEAHITWDNGMRHVLRREGQGFKKLFWPSGASPHSPPGNTTLAVKQSELPPTITTEPASKRRMTGEYPLIAGKWAESSEKDTFVTIYQNGNKFVANCTYKEDNGVEVHWDGEGTISREGEIMARLVHTRPRNYVPQTRIGKLAPNGKTINFHAKLDNGEEQNPFWKLREPSDASESLAPPDGRNTGLATTEVLKADKDRRKQLPIVESADRKTRLADWTERKKRDLAPLIAECDKYKTTFSTLDKKSDQLSTKSLHTLSNKYDSQIDKLETQKREIGNKLELATRRLNSKMRDYWLEERRIIKDTRREPDDPTYIEYMGMLYTESELEEVKAIMEGRGTVWAAGNTYIQELIGRKVVEAASPDRAARDGTPDGGIDLFYQVRYVSKSGAVMQRLGYIHMKSREADGMGQLSNGVYLPYQPNGSFTGEYWYVSSMTKLVGISIVP